MEIPAEYFTKMPSTSREKKIVLCTRCHGDGNVKVITEDPGYEGPMQTTCPRCDGSGRLWMIVTTEYQPLK